MSIMKKTSQIFGIETPCFLMGADQSCVTNFNASSIPSRSQEQLLASLREQGIRNLEVLNAIRETPRHLFVDEALSSHAYANHPLPIGYGQTISQPFVVARMTEALLNHAPLDIVLEIGSGCGYQTAILARLANKVYSVERIKRFYKSASTRLKSLALANVEFKYGDGYQGWTEHAPYQSIMVTAAPETIPSALLQQLAIGGCMIIPVGPRRGTQVLLKLIRTRTHFEQYTLEDVNFVPLQQGLS